MSTDAPWDAVLLRIVDECMDCAIRLAGDRLVFRPGCTLCCLGPFPVTRLDAARLQDGLRTLRCEDPERARRVFARARAAAELFRKDFPGDPATGSLGVDEDREEAFLSRHGAVPCPALDPDAGTCDLYAHRPISCRTFGPPVRIGSEDLPPCQLCFVGVCEAEVARCRIEPDPDGIEESILSRMEDGDSQTLVAFALAEVEA